jgi:hypothetical protein
MVINVVFKFGPVELMMGLYGASEMRLRASENGTQLARWGK